VGAAARVRTMTSIGHRAVTPPTTGRSPPAGASAFGGDGGDRQSQARAVAAIERALASGRVSGRWATRLRTVQAMNLFELGQYEQSEAVANAALREAERSTDRFAVGYAPHALARLLVRDRDRQGVLACRERVLDAIGEGEETADLRVMEFACYADALMDADRLDEARQALREALRLAERAAPARLAAIRSGSATVWYETGDWDDALAELEDVYSPRSFSTSRSMPGGRSPSACGTPSARQAATSFASYASCRPRRRIAGAPSRSCRIAAASRRRSAAIRSIGGSR
jgi:hypothetical protein